MSIRFDPERHTSPETSELTQIQTILQRLHSTLERDQVIQSITDELRKFLQVNRVVLYYFFREWEGRVTFESLSDQTFSILGSTGPDECFNEEYAQLYLEGRVRAIADIKAEAIAPCHREFLQQLRVRANLVVPILTQKGLWGLLVAHHCKSTKDWSAADIEQMKQGALKLANASSIQTN
ncbi:MAG: GAF domain-containing protein [Phormidesmis sp.]